MITHLRIENYQSHALTDIDISPTVTVFTGESDQGKTAVLRAVRKVLRNSPTGDFFVRWGQKVCRVALTVDGVDVERTVGVKKSGLNTYTVGKDAYNNFGTSVPEDVRVALRVADVQTFDKDKIDFNVHTQHEGEFLVGKSGVEALRGRIFARATGSDVVNRAIVGKNAEIRALKQELDRKILQRRELQAKLDVLLPVRDAGALLVSVEDSYGTVLHLKSEIDTLQALGTELQTLSSAIQRTKVIEQVPPLIAQPVEDRLTRVLLAQRLYEEVRATHALLNRLRPLDTLPTFSVDGLETVVNSLVGLRNLFQELKTTWATVKRLRAMNLESMRFDLGGINVALNTRNACVALQEQLCLNEMQMRETEAQLANNDVDVAQMEYEQAKTELAVCPLCERPFEEPHTLPGYGG